MEKYIVTTVLQPQIKSRYPLRLLLFLVASVDLKNLALNAA